MTARLVPADPVFPNNVEREVCERLVRNLRAFIGRFEELGREWGLEIDADRNESEFWEKELPAQMAALAQNLPEGKKFDAIIVDEAQDFAEDWWIPLLAALKSPEEGGLFVYSDENQRVFARFGRPPVQLVPLVLDHNLRNTKQIAESFSSLAPMRMRSLGGDGPEVRFVQASPDEALGVADDEVDRLLDAGWRPEDVALITTGSRHPEQNSRQEDLGQEGYWRTFWENDDVFYGHVLGCKGLERRAVVLCVNEEATRDRSKERLYVGLSRANGRADRGRRRRGAPGGPAARRSPSAWDCSGGECQKPRQF